MTVDQLTIYRALDRLMPDDADAHIDCGKPTPTNYDEYVAAVRDGETPYSLDALLAASAEQSAIEAAAITNTAEARLAAMSAAFDALPMDVQIQFATPFATVHDLVKTGRVELARHYVERIPVPAELLGTRDEVAAMLR